MTVLTAGGIVVQLLRLRPPDLGSLLAAPLFVLAIAAGAFVVRPLSAGFIAGAACALFVLVPLYSALPMSKALAAQRYGRARFFARLATVLNPIAPRFRTLKTIALLEAIEQGKVSASDLDWRDTSPEVRSTLIHVLRAQARYAEIVDYCRSVPAAQRDRDVGLLSHEVRALGETARYEEMIALAKQIQGRRDAQRVLVDVRMMMLAFLGQVELTNRFAAQRAKTLSTPIADFWRATALAAAGDERATPAFEALTQATHSSVRIAAQHRLARPVAKVELDTIPGARAFVEEIAADAASAQGMDSAGGPTVATRIVLAAVAVMFCIQIPGGSTDIANLIDLGALIIPPVSGLSQPWRLISAAFLHLGFAHFAMNSLGLWILGRRVEGALGSVKLVVVFLGTAILGNEAAVLFMHGPAVVVGASGGVLGLLGAVVGVVLNRRRRGPTRYLDGVLREVAGIAVMQVAFDMVMPNIGSIVHIGGFVSGVVLGFLLTPAEPSSAKISTR